MEITPSNTPSMLSSPLPPFIIPFFLYVCVSFPPSLALFSCLALSRLTPVTGRRELPARGSSAVPARSRPRSRGAAGRCPHGPGGGGDTGEAEGGRSCIADGAAGSRGGAEGGEGPRKAAWAARATGARSLRPAAGGRGRDGGGRRCLRVPARAAERPGAVSAAGGRSRQPGQRRPPGLALRGRRRGRGAAAGMGRGAAGGRGAGLSPAPSASPSGAARLGHTGTLPALPPAGRCRRLAAVPSRSCEGAGGRLGKLFVRGSCRCHAEFSALRAAAWLWIHSWWGRQSKKASREAVAIKSKKAIREGLPGVM